MASPSPPPPPADDRPLKSAARSDTRDRLDRSRSPARDKRPKKPKGGFRWKDNQRDDAGDEQGRGSRPERGYGDRYRDDRSGGDRYRDDRYSGDRRRDDRDDRSRQSRYRDDRDGYRARDDRRRDREDDTRRDRRQERDRSPESGRRRSGERAREGERDRGYSERNTGADDGLSKSGSKEKKERREKKEKSRKIAPPQEAMIVVHVNDRLGTKAAIACLPSDPIKIFKMQVAAQIGREPHEILVKRQGERPFKDQLTLEDYGVGNGVQLDLEVDTGD